MSHRRLLGACALAAASAAVAVTFTSPSAGFAVDDVGAVDAVSRDAVTGIDPAMRAAMKRDLSLSDAQVDSRLRMEAKAPAVEDRLRAALGQEFGGAWIADGATTLSVGVTSSEAAATVREAGARPVLVERSSTELDADRAKLDRRAEQAPDAVRSWRVDTATNEVVVVAAPGAEAKARAFARQAGATDVVVETEAAKPRTVYDTIGGEQYSINGSTLCSVGFAVDNGGFVTAGHCGGVGSQTAGVNGAAQGSFAGSSFPGNDYAFVQTNGDWVSRPWVTNYAGQLVVVLGSDEAAVGSSICRSGRTTGYQCGTLQGKNETVNYDVGPVYGLHRTNACANPGDSGGSVLSANQAQGVTSGISAGCGQAGPQTWYQPVNEILQAYGLTLTRG